MLEVSVLTVFVLFRRFLLFIRIKRGSLFYQFSETTESGSVQILELLLE
jgi:hypothetical protein